MSTTTTSLEAKHHHSTSSTSITPTSKRTFPRDIEGEPTHPTSISHIDRDSAIALGVILILVLAVLAWYVRLRIKTRRQADEERQTALERRDSISRGDALRRYGARARAADPSFRMERLWSRDANKKRDSVSTLRGSMSTEGKGEKEREYAGSEGRGSISTMATTSGNGDGSSTTDHDSHHSDHAKSRSPSPRSLSRKPSLDQSSIRSRHRRQSSVHDVPDTLLAELQSRRPSSQSQTQFDRRWWSEVAHRGSAAHMDRRLSVLEPIPEPGMMDGAVVQQQQQQQQRRRSEVAWEGNKLPTTVCSRSGYDWTRPSVVASGSLNNAPRASQNAKLDGFKSIVWADQCLKQNPDEDTNISQSGTSKKSEGIERVDWATNIQGSPDPACQ